MRQLARTEEDHKKLMMRHMCGITSGATINNMSLDQMFAMKKEMRASKLNMATRLDGPNVQRKTKELLNLISNGSFGKSTRTKNERENNSDYNENNYDKFNGNKPSGEEKK